jgi:SPP1 family predicted phage head-tail adaptor
MLSGRLRERITILSRSVTLDALGQEDITWSSIGSFWAEAVYSTSKGDGNETFSAGQLQDMNTIRFRVRYNTAVTQEHRLEWNSVGYDIVAVTHETHKYTIIRAIEKVKDGRD